MGLGRLVFGTRGSALARWQTEFVMAALRRVAPEGEMELRVISTAGDRDQTRPLAEFGALGVFTTELENALRAGEIDAAVHSLKDLPTDAPDDLAIAAILEREDARDVLVSRHGVGLRQLPQGARVGTSSARRAAQVLGLRPDLEIVPLRGNVDTRLKKAATDEYDAIVLAAAGLLRLGRGDAITEYFAVEELTPDPGQGALAVQIRKDNRELAALLQQIDHAPTRAAVTAERAFLLALGGGCRTPMAAYAEPEGEQLHLRGMVAAEDGMPVRAEMKAAIDEPDALGAALAREIMAKGGGALAGIEMDEKHAPRISLQDKRIVITRAETQAQELADKVLARGGVPIFFPVIAFAPPEDFAGLDAALEQIDSFDWVVFTSANGVRAVGERFDHLATHHTNIGSQTEIASSHPSSALRSAQGLLAMTDKARTDNAMTDGTRTDKTGLKIAAIGTGTAREVERLGLAVDFVPSEFLGAQIAKELPVERGARVLLLRADLASDELAEGLKARGVEVTDVDAYRTVRAQPEPIDWTEVDAVTFTSASTVQNAWTLLNETERGTLATRDIFCIGPVTTKAAEALGLKVTATADIHTLDGLVGTMRSYYERKNP